MARLAMAEFEAILNQCDKLVVVEGGDFVGCDRRAELHDDCSGAGQCGAAGKSAIGAVDSDGQQRHAGAAGEGTEAGFERGDAAVATATAASIGK